MALSTLNTALVLGMIFAIMSLGVFVSFKILNIPDLTVDGSFTCGCAVCAICCVNHHPLLGLLLAFIAGCLAGLLSGFLHTKCKVQAILAGILTMTALYSINLKIMKGMPNISLFDQKTLFTIFEPFFGKYCDIVVVATILLVLIIVMYLFLKTQLGMSLRACGDNEAMVRASSINTDAMKMLGFAIANGIVAFAGAVFTQNRGFADVSGGIGMMVVGLASIIVGDTLIRNKSMLMQLVAVWVGAIVYRLILTIALQFGVAANDMNLVSAILVALAISMPYLKKQKRGGRHA